MAVLKDVAHPGEVLVQLYLLPIGWSAGQLARRLKVPRTRIERLVKGKTSLSLDTARRLSRLFGHPVEYWLNLQRNYDLAHAPHNEDLAEIKPLKVA